MGKHLVFQIFIEEQKIPLVLSHITLLLTFFCPPNGGVVIVFVFLLQRPSKKVQILDSRLKTRHWGGLGW